MRMSKSQILDCIAFYKISQLFWIWVCRLKGNFDYPVVMLIAMYIFTTGPPVVPPHEVCWLNWTLQNVTFIRKYVNVFVITAFFFFQSRPVLMFMCMTVCLLNHSMPRWIRNASRMRMVYTTQTFKSYSLKMRPAGENWDRLQTATTQSMQQ